MKKIYNKDIEKQIIELKKELIFYKIKKATKQDIKPHIVKHTKRKISKLFTLDKLQSK